MKIVAGLLVIAFALFAAAVTWALLVMNGYAPMPSAWVERIESGTEAIARDTNSPTEPVPAKPRSVPTGARVMVASDSRDGGVDRPVLVRFEGMEYEIAWKYLYPVMVSADPPPRTPAVAP
jgi:hypothetical protein